MTNNISKKIAIALSGGVDSAVAAKILQNEGYEVIGLFLKLWSDPKCQLKGENRCCDYEALEDARRVAANLKIPFYVIGAKEEFKKQVVDYFIDEYKHLRTPNPCVICNEKIKFDLLLKKALQIGCDYLATGHYARIENAGNPKSEILNSKQIQNSNSQNTKQASHPACPPLAGESRDLHNNLEDSPQNTQNDREEKVLTTRYSLLAGVDASKDQSYNLYRLNQEQLAHIIFPLGEMTKKLARELAEKWNLPVKEKPESQEICFFGDKDYREFLRRYLPDNYFEPGKIADSRGNIIGEHKGLINYTIGQRKNINQTFSSVIPDLPARRIGGIRNPFKTDSRLRGNDKNKKPLYVIGYNIENNRLIVGEDGEVYSKEMVVGNLHWINEEAISYQLPANSLSCKIRSQAQKVKCEIGNNCHPELARPERGRRDSGSFSVKIRSQAQKVKCMVIGRHCEELATKQSDPKKIATSLPKQQSLAMTELKVFFDQPQRAVTPGQSAVFYDGDEVIGGGIIQ